MSHLPAQPMPSARRPGPPSVPRPNELRDFPDLSATVRPPPAPIAAQGGLSGFFRNAVSLPSSPTLREKFMHSSSRVVRLVDVRATPTNLLWNLFTHACSQNKIATPTPMLAHSDSGGPNTLSGGIWAVFSSHEDARAALTLGCDIFSVSPALESDLSMHPSLKRLNLDHPQERELPPRLAHSFLPPLTIPDMAPSRDIYSTGGGRSPFHSAPPSQSAFGEPPFTISSNPPNPKTSFRAGDWMCSAPNCSAHNFQRNISCIVCGRPRSGGAPPLSLETAHPPGYPLANPSPRFATRSHSTPRAPPPLQSPASLTNFPFTGPPPPPPMQQAPSKAPPPQYPPLTPSGRALSVGGRVRNVSRDPLAPCVMYWPDNEPLPEPCQIRPMDSTLMTFPPIINTGNKGAAEKQPGDWLCGKCNYHNWRRRKVCQTCFPYAEGNGDSISAAVQAERIALLANVLATQFNVLDLDGLPSHPPPAPAHAPTQQPPTSAPPFQVRMNIPPIGAGAGFLRGRDSRDTSPLSDHFPMLLPLPLAEHDKDASPIYQTSNARVPQPIGRGAGTHPPRFGAGPGALMTSSPAATRTLLPAFLQDMVHSPSLSPSSASSSSADLSFDGSSEDAHYASSAGTSAHSHSHQQHGHGHGPVQLTHPSAGQQQLYGGNAHHNASTSSFTSLSGRTGSSSAAAAASASASSIWQLDGEESRTLTGPSPGPGPVARQSPPQAVTSPSGGSAASPRAHAHAHDATPKSTHDFWQVRYN